MAAMGTTSASWTEDSHMRGGLQFYRLEPWVHLPQPLREASALADMRKLRLREVICSALLTRVTAGRPCSHARLFCAVKGGIHAGRGQDPLLRRGQQVSIKGTSFGSQWGGFQRAGGWQLSEVVTEPSPRPPHGLRHKSLERRAGDTGRTGHSSDANPSPGPTV